MADLDAHVVKFHCPSCGIGIETNRLADAMEEMHKALEKCLRKS